MKTKMKVLLTSLVSIALSASIAVGGTFALFTDQAAVNVAVTSGTVDVEAKIKDNSLKTYSRGIPQAAGYFANDAGTAQGAVVDATTGELKLNYITPGDKAEFVIEVENKSNVDIEYRAVAEIVGDAALVNNLVWTSSAKNWTFVEGGTAIAPVTVSVELPEDVTYTMLNGNNDKTPKQYSATVKFMIEAIQGNGRVDYWDGTADTSWYDNAPAEQTEFKLDKAEQVAGLAELVDGGETFEGKTIKLENNLDLYKLGDDGEPVSFEPIGSYRNDTGFKGTFDGQGNTISNMYQSGWALDNEYYMSDLGLGLFGLVEGATIKNLNIDGANQPSEYNLIGSVAGAAYGECTFENITVTNSYSGNHSYYSGGIVGWASGNHKYINCDVDASTVISSQWGDFNNANGGLIGGAGSSGTYYFEDCDVACQIDAYSDVTSAYEWWSYRNAGMLIGKTGHTQVIDGTTYAAAPNVTCKNVTVTYGEWADYHYCKFSAMSYPYVRVEAGSSTNAYGNARYYPAYDANGNEVVDENHVHNVGEHHNQVIVFDQLFGGPVENGGRTCVYGMPTHDGVTVIYNNDKQ